MKTILKIIVFFAGIRTVQAQDSTEVERRIFLPSIDMGYIHPTTDVLKGTLITRTSLEYRFNNNNDFFIRLNYNTYGSRYQLQSLNNLSNTIEGTVKISDVFLSPGYRFGDQKYRLMFALMPGIKFYEYPTANVNGQQIEISQKGKSTFTSSLLSTLEYYFDEKSAFTLSLFQNQVWSKRDFWENGTAAYGASLGFITSLR